MFEYHVRTQISSSEVQNVLNYMAERKWRLVSTERSSQGYYGLFFERSLK